MILRPDFVVVASHVLSNGMSEMRDYALSSFTADSERTAYSKLRDTVLQDMQDKVVSWVSVNIVIGDRLVTCMKGSLDWFLTVQYFKTIVGSMGGSIDMEPVAYGFIDYTHNIRVELQNGVVCISQA